MKKLKSLIKNLLLKIPIVNHIFILHQYKIFKTTVSIHGHKSLPMCMTKRNFAIYDKKEIGFASGLDKDLNYEFAFSKKIIDFADENKIFFDVGAAYGHYTWLASKLYKKVYAFEGDPLEIFFLKKNMKNFNNIKIIDRYIDDNYNLDKICNDLKIIPDIVKMDIEGAEINLVKNIDSLLKNKTSFLIEFHQRKILKKFKDTEVIDKFFETFKKHNYNIKFNHHHDYENLLSNGTPHKEWLIERPIINNFAIFASKN